jgi:23S rRNA pseudouridine2605 synthase
MRGGAPAAAAAKGAEAAGPQRIAKLLARAGVASRRDIERMIAEGRIALDGQTLTTPATLLTDLSRVTVDGKPVAEPEATRLFLFHKPAGCLTTARDPKGRRTIYDILPKDLPRLQPIGRLDMNTEGLLLLTTDGELKRALELPANAVERKYRVRVYGRVEQSALESLSEGVTIEGVRYGPILADLERRTGANAWLTMTLTEGKNREVRRVAEHLGLKVTRLIRTAYGPFSLGESEPGEIAEASPADVAKLQKRLK